MMTIELNGQHVALPETLSLQEALKHLGYPEGSFAIAVNRTFVPQTHYAHTLLKPNDILDIVAPMCGG